MTPIQSATPSATGRQRQIFVRRPAESVPLPAQPPPPQLSDPPIYRDLLQTWAGHGRTLPGRHDPEWVRLAAPLVLPGQFSGSPGPRDGGR
ncbi:hypothetical protein [Streptomyces sp. NPDC057877]|uniref:hypothetical protein n=1 Tax=Streptomyces sp. NPDC057877 TaxID=3346269 RepID=UPI003684D0A7